MQQTNKSTINGIALIAGGTVGAGMFSLPIVASGMWFGWAVLCMALVWLVNLGAALLLLESNLLYPVGASFSTMVADSLGQKWRLFNNFFVAFILYILLYAYFSASGSIVGQSYTSVFGSALPVAQNIASVISGLIIALFVMTGASIVGRLCSLLLVGMIITFFLSTSGLLLNLEIAKLIQTQTSALQLSTFSWAALPYFVTSFGCAAIIPSLMKHYGHDAIKIKHSIVWGTFISLIIYLIFLAAIFGNLSRPEMVPIIQAGGNVGNLVTALNTGTANPGLRTVLNLFSNFAIVTSFLGIGLSLFDYIADHFKFDDSVLGRAKSASLTFLPPAILSYLFPHGFITAIGYAGLAVLISFYFVPVAMAYTNRPKQQNMIYKVKGGKLVLLVIATFSVVVGSFKIIAPLGLLPVFP